VVDGTLALFPPRRARRIHGVGRECAKTITGYISGTLLISAICGLLTYIVLKIFGVPFAELIPLIGATLAALIHSLPAATTVLAIPIAGVIQVILRDVWNHRAAAPHARPDASKPAATPENQVQAGADQSHEQQRERVSPHPVLLGHVAEVHPVDRADQRGSEQDRRP
jgi:hypothetical protein